MLRRKTSGGSVISEGSVAGRYPGADIKQNIMRGTVAAADPGVRNVDHRIIVNSTSRELVYAPRGAFDWESTMSNVSKSSFGSSPPRIMGKKIANCFAFSS